jgi:hypothetical protein
MLRVLLSIICCYSLTAQEDLTANREHVRSAFRKMRLRASLKDDYLYTRRQEKRELLADGTVKSKSALTTRRDPWEDQLVMRVIAKDDQALPAEEIQKQEERLRKQVIELRRNPPKPRIEEETWMMELPDALDFYKAGLETRGGRVMEMYEFRPRPGYQAKESRARAFEKVKGKVWVDQQDLEVAKLEVIVVDTINIGFGVLGKLEKGTQFELERKKWEIGVWYEEWQKVRFDIRLMLVKSLRQEIETRWLQLSLRPPTKMIRSGS